MTKSRKLLSKENSMRYWKEKSLRANGNVWSRSDGKKLADELHKIKSVPQTSCETSETPHASKRYVEELYVNGEQHQKQSQHSTQKPLVADND